MNAVRHAADSAPEAPLPDARDFRLAVVVSRFNDDITARLRDGAVEALTVAGAPADAIEVFEVPGAFELPWAARVAATSGRFDAVICLGCVIRGETYHFEVIANTAAQGVMAVACDTGVPVTFGVLTTDTTQQALERAAMDRSNKGWEAAVAALELVHLGRRMAGGDDES
jgi:6,7-dimethyl-8-ribityllumazine synthase